MFSFTLVLPGVEADGDDFLLVEAVNHHLDEVEERGFADVPRPEDADGEGTFVADSSSDNEVGDVARAETIALEIRSGVVLQEDQRFEVMGRHGDKGITP